jgi:hypothetical protein
MAWQPAHPSSTPPAKPASSEEPAKTEQTDLSLDNAADHDHFSHVEDDQAGTDPTANKQSSSEKSINPEDVPALASPAASPAAKSRWRPARPTQGNPISESPQQRD